MTPSRLQDLYDAGVRREKKHPEPADETEDQKNRRILLHALQQQQSQDEQRKSKKTKYVKKDK